MPCRPLLFLTNHQLGSSVIDTIDSWSPFLNGKSCDAKPHMPWKFQTEARPEEQRPRPDQRSKDRPTARLAAPQSAMAVNASGYLFGSAKEVKQRFAFVMLDCDRSFAFRRRCARPLGY